jgi:hypothetical protein
MPPVRLPGPPTIAALMLAAILTAWIGIWGPIKLDVLREWQTLLAAIIAPSIAIVAALIAYRGAMAGVNLEREIHHRQQASSKLGLHLRLISQMQRLLEDAIFTGDHLRDEVEHAKKHEDDNVKNPVTLNDDYDEVEKAWERLELLPAAAFEPLDLIRTNLRIAKGLRNNRADGENFLRWRAVQYVRRCEKLSKHAEEIIPILKASIEELKRFE